ncbi:hypothetical protein FI667_g7576, partial [Globisporangium splendens]
MKEALRTLQPTVSSNDQNQLVVANNNNSHRSSLTRKTRSAVEAWLGRLFLSDAKKKPKQTKRQLTRRASTGSLTTDTPQERKRRHTLFFSRKSKDDSATSSTQDPAALWLQFVPSLSDLDCELTFDASLDDQNSDFGSDASFYAETLVPELEDEPVLQSYIIPPISMPNDYRLQDRRGGMIVAGRLVLFTNAAFKRKLRHISDLDVIPEDKPAYVYDSRLDMYLSGRTTEFDEIAGIAPLSQWI